MAFAVVLDAKYSAYIATTQYPAVMLERLSREAVKVADGPMNLLETMEVDFSFRKVLTREFCFFLQQDLQTHSTFGYSFQHSHGVSYCLRIFTL